MLSDRLKELESYGLVSEPSPGTAGPRAVRADAHGPELAPALEELKRWARHWLRLAPRPSGSSTTMPGRLAISSAVWPTPS